MTFIFRVAMTVAVLACCALRLAQAGEPGVPAPRAADITPASVDTSLLAAAQAGGRIVAVGDNGVVLLSDNGGRHYRQAREVPVDAMLTGVSFVDDRFGWAVGHRGAIIQTRDRGETWTLQRDAAQEDRPLFAVHFFDRNEGVAVGLWSLVLRTSDGGATWTPVTMEPPPGAKKADLNLLGLFTDAKGTLYACGERGYVLASTDRGRHWRYLRTGAAGTLWAGTALVDANGNETLLVGGLRGALYRSTDGGEQWSAIPIPSKGSITALASSGRDVVAVGLDGVRASSTDGGATFKVETLAQRTALTAVLPGADGAWVLFSRAGPVAGAR